jgi:predicted porin
MNKKLMAVAVAGALAAPGVALAQVTIQGSLNIEYGVLVDQLDGPGGKGPSVDAFNSGASWIRFSGEEKMGGGMSTWFQCENRARLGVDTVASAAAGGFCDRNTAVGLKGGFGNVFFGRWDSPLNIAQDAGRAGLLNTTGWGGVERLLLGDGGANGGGFDFARRNASAVNYITPNFGGFSVSLQYTAQNAAVVNAPPAAAFEGRAISGSADYSSGPLAASVAFSKHDDNQNTVTGGAGLINTEETALLVGASYTFGPVKVGVLWTSMEGEPTTTTKRERDNWSLGVAWKITPPGTVRAGIAEAGELEGNAAPAGGNNGARVWVVGYSHALSKRTTGTIYYSKLDNDTSGTYAFPFATAGGVLAGSSGSATVLQLQHKF